MEDELKLALARKLLRHSIVGWQDAETGAPGINPKRPYGNSDVVRDIRKILGLDISAKTAMGIHRMTEDALRELVKSRIMGGVE